MREVAAAFTTPRLPAEDEKMREPEVIMVRLPVWGTLQAIVRG